MIITDGTTTLTFTYASNEGPDTEIEMAQKTSSGGKIKAQISGERFTTTEMIAVTGAQLRQLLDLLKGNAEQFYYTPTSTPPEYDAADFPMAVHVKYKGKSVRAYNNHLPLYYVRLEIEAVNYYA